MAPYNVQAKHIYYFTGKVMGHIKDVLNADENFEQPSWEFDILWHLT